MNNPVIYRLLERATVTMLEPLLELRFPEEFRVAMSKDIVEFQDKGFNTSPSNVELLLKRRIRGFDSQVLGLYKALHNWVKGNVLIGEERRGVCE